MNDNKQVENIRKFLATAYSDEQLAALLAHTESGRLSYYSCCCLVGIPTATHALQGAGEYIVTPEDNHLARARTMPFGVEAEWEFTLLSIDDTARRALLLPLIREEMNQREFNRLLKQCDEMSATVREGSKLLAEAREGLSKALKEISVTGEFAQVSCGVEQAHATADRSTAPGPIGSTQNSRQSTNREGFGHSAGIYDAEVDEAERKHHCTAHRLTQEAAERWPGEEE